MKRYNWKEEREKLQTWKREPETPVCPVSEPEAGPARRRPPFGQWILLILAVGIVGYFIYERNRTAVSPTHGEPPPRAVPEPGDVAAAQREAPDSARLVQEARKALEQGDNRTAVEQLKKAMDAGNLEAKLILAVFLIEGKIVKPNVDAGMRMLAETAEAGLPAAQFILAKFLIEGELIGQDMPRGLEYLRKSAEAGYADGQFYWGVVLIGGKHVAGNIPLGVEFLKKAAAQGHEEARKALAQQQEAGETHSDFRIAPKKTTTDNHLQSLLRQTVGNGASVIAMPPPPSGGKLRNEGGYSTAQKP